MSAVVRFDVRLARHRDRIDSVEVVDVEDGEVVLFWDLEAGAAAARVRELRASLRELDAEEFVARWSTV